MSYDNTNTGAIFKNDKKSDNAPDYKGTINIDGVDKDIALWIKTSKDGSKQYFSAKISEPFKKEDLNKSLEELKSTTTKVENDLPF